MCYGKYEDLCTDNPPECRTFRSTYSLALKAKQSIDPKADAGKHLGVVGRSALYDIPYYDPIRDNVLDMMHLTSGVIGRHLVKLLTGERLRNLVATERKETLREKKRTPAQVAADESADEVRATEKARLEEMKAKKAATTELNREKAAYRARGQAQVKAQRALIKANQRKDATHARSSAGAASAAAAALIHHDEQSEVSTHGGDQYSR
jgi:cell division septum initiation protein DivIVA